jgi:hypothetical protein
VADRHRSKLLLKDEPDERTQGQLTDSLLGTVTAVDPHPEEHYIILRYEDGHQVLIAATTSGLIAGPILKSDDEGFVLTQAF